MDGRRIGHASYSRLRLCSATWFWRLTICQPQAATMVFIHGTGEEGRKERKKGEKGEIVGDQAHFLCFVKSTVY